MRNTFRSLHRKSRLTTCLGARSPGRREALATWRCLSLRTRTWPSAVPMGFSRRMRVWGEKFIMEFFGKKIHRQHHFSFRGLFVIDKSGTLRQITINDLPVGRDVDETLRLVQVILIYLEIPKRRIFTNNLKEKTAPPCSISWCSPGFPVHRWTWWGLPCRLEAWSVTNLRYVALQQWSFAILLFFFMARPAYEGYWR